MNRLSNDTSGPQKPLRPIKTSYIEQSRNRESYTWQYDDITNVIMPRSRILKRITVKYKVRKEGSRKAEVTHHKITEMKQPINTRRY